MIKNKYFILLFIVIAVIFAISWAFNHINPWLAFAIGMLFIYGFNEFLNKQINKQK
jgi:hypothetical protein